MVEAISDKPESNSTAPGTVSTIGGDIWAGVKDEVANHRSTLATDGFIGGAITVGTAALGPKVAVVVGAIGLGLGAKALVDHSGEWRHAGDVLGDQSKYSAAEVGSAHNTFKGIGRGSAELAAGAVGGSLGFAAAKSISARAIFSYAPKGFVLPGENSHPSIGASSYNGLEPMFPSLRNFAYAADNTKSIPSLAAELKVGSTKPVGEIYAGETQHDATFTLPKTFKDHAFFYDRAQEMFPNQARLRHYANLYMLDKAGIAGYGTLLNSELNALKTAKLGTIDALDEIVAKRNP